MHIYMRILICVDAYETVDAAHVCTIRQSVFLLAQGQSDTLALLITRTSQPTSPLSLATQPQPFEVSLEETNHGLTRVATRWFSNM